MSSLTGYLAAAGREEELARELPAGVERFGRLFLAPGGPLPVAWALNVWRAPRRIPIASIAEGARALRALQRNWWLYSHDHHRRATLLRDQLPHVSARPVAHPSERPSAPLGSFTLLDATMLLASPDCSSPFPNGEVRFVEDRQAPPSRAYLKLWEALLRMGSHPREGELCLDLGSSPGGWSWAAQALGAQVISVDKAPLDPQVAASPRVEFRQQSAFTLAPESLPPVDWLLCDVACEPARLRELLAAWLDSGRCRRVVATVKLKGRWEPGQTADLAALPGGRLVHLHHNKHELTWLWIAPHERP